MPQTSQSWAAAVAFPGAADPSPWGRRARLTSRPARVQFENGRPTGLLPKAANGQEEGSCLMQTEYDTDQVPVVNIAPFLSGTQAKRQGVVEAVSWACENIGFFIITGHGIPGALVERLTSTARTFFDLPETTKREVDRTGEVMGGLMYFPFGAESLGAASGEAAPQDQKETLDFGLRFRGDSWPPQPAELKEICQSYEEAVGALALRLRNIFMAALGLPEDFVEDKFSEHLSSVRILNYPNRVEPPLPGQLRAGVHTDYGVLTILHTEDSPGGLQVRAKDGAWIDVVAVPNAFVVNIGDAMMRWTNDRWVSTPHRVTNPPRNSRGSTRRQSIAYFCNPNGDAMIECLPGFSGPGSPAKYEPITYRAYAEERYRQAHGEEATLGK